ncbi:MAG: NUMOD4 domain-containing protein [Candidatus Odinarchaeia archaeon]
MNENWKPLLKFNNFYEVSNLGNIRSIARTIITKNNVQRKLKSKQLKTFINENGYSIVSIRFNNLHYNLKIHRVVATVFISNPKHKLTINHKDGNKQNNNVLNLEWATHSENIKHAYNNKLNHNDNQLKPVLQFSKTGMFIHEHKSISAAKKFLNIKGGHIGEVCIGNRKSAYGYVWEFK